MPPFLSADCSDHSIGALVQHLTPVQLKPRAASKRHASCNENRPCQLELAPMNGQKALETGERACSATQKPFRSSAVELRARPKLINDQQATRRSLRTVRRPGIVAVACVKQGCSHFSHWQEDSVLQLDTPATHPAPRHCSGQALPQRSVVWMDCIDYNTYVTIYIRSFVVLRRQETPQAWLERAEADWPSIHIFAY